MTDKIRFPKPIKASIIEHDPDTCLGSKYYPTKKIDGWKQKVKTKLENITRKSTKYDCEWYTGYNEMAREVLEMLQE